MNRLQILRHRDSNSLCLSWQTSAKTLTNHSIGFSVQHNHNPMCCYYSFICNTGIWIWGWHLRSFDCAQMNWNKNLFSCLKAKKTTVLLAQSFTGVANIWFHEQLIHAWKQRQQALVQCIGIQHAKTLTLRLPECVPVLIWAQWATHTAD